MTKGGLIWDKKWVLASVGGLTVYSFAHGTDAAPFAWIPYKQIVGVSISNRLEMPAPFAFKLHLSLPWLNDASVFTPRPITVDWKDMLTDAGQERGNLLEIFIMADTESQMEKWVQFLKFHAGRNNPHTMIR